MNMLFPVFAILVLPATWLIFYLGQQEKYELKNGESIFRFPRTFLIGVFIFALFPLLIGCQMIPSIADSDFQLLGILICVLSFLPILLLYALMRFYFSIGIDAVTWRQFNSVKTLTWNHIKLIKFDDGWRSGMAFGVIPAKRGSKVAIRIYDTNGLAVNLACYLQDIDTLQHQLLSRANAHHVPIEGSDQYQDQFKSAISSSSIFENHQDPSTRKPNWLVVILMFGPIFYFIFNGSNQAAIAARQRYQDEAAKIMQQECAKKCASYGITATDLVGPTLERESRSKYRQEYRFAWHSTTPQVTFKVDINWSRKYNEQITPTWIATGAKRDSMDIKLTLHHYDNAMHQVINAIPAKSPLNSGMIDFNFQITASGKVINASIASSTLHNADVEQQLLGVIEGMSFGSGDYGVEDYNYRLNIN